MCTEIDLLCVFYHPSVCPMSNSPLRLVCKIIMYLKYLNTHYCVSVFDTNGKVLDRSKTGGLLKIIILLGEQVVVSLIVAVVFRCVASSTDK